MDQSVFLEMRSASHFLPIFTMVSISASVMSSCFSKSGLSRGEAGDFYFVENADERGEPLVVIDGEVSAAGDEKGGALARASRAIWAMWVSPGVARSARASARGRKCGAKPPVLRAMVEVSAEGPGRRMA